MIDSRDFIKNSLWCEYAYYVNLDTGNFEVWIGFQNKPTSGGMERYGVEKSEDGYYPCKLSFLYPLEKIFGMKEEDVEELVGRMKND